MAPAQKRHPGAITVAPLIKASCTRVKLDSVDGSRRALCSKVREWYGKHCLTPLARARRLASIPLDPRNDETTSSRHSRPRWSRVPTLMRVNDRVDLSTQFKRTDPFIRQVVPPPVE